MIQPPRQISDAIQPKVNEALDGLKAQNIIADMDRPTDWVRNLVIVENKSGALRLCLDPRRSSSTVWHESIHSGRHEEWLLAREAKRIIVVLLHLEHAMGLETLPSNALRNLLSKRHNAETKRGNIWRHSMCPRHC